MTTYVHHTCKVFLCSVGYAFWWRPVVAETCKDNLLHSHIKLIALDGPYQSFMEHRLSHKILFILKLYECSVFKWCIRWLDMQLIWWSYLPNWIGESNRPGVMPPTPQRLSPPPNIPEEQSPSDMLPKGGNPWDGKRAPGVLNTFVVFFLFFHLALRFWNHTCELTIHCSYHLLLVLRELIYINTFNATNDICRLKIGSHFLYILGVWCYGESKTVLRSLRTLSWPF
jgi:hypothetical protein